MLLDWGALIRPSVGPVPIGQGSEETTEAPFDPGAAPDPGQDTAAPLDLPALTDAADNRAALACVVAELRKGLLLQHHHFPLPAIWWARSPENMAKVLTEAGAPVDRGVMRCCLSCRYRFLPGLAFPGYCGTRADLPPAYGPGHPLRELPADAGASCPSWGVRPAFPVVL